MSNSFLLSFIFEMTICLSFAEICSAFPKNGSVFYWSTKLATPEYANFTSYLVGWFYVLAGMANFNIGSL